MKILVSTFTLALALAIPGGASAQDLTKATTKEDCEKAGGAWKITTISLLLLSAEW